MTNDTPSAPLLPDNPISSSDQDVLEWTSVSTTFVRRILEIDTTHGLVVGVFGSWGSGKTSFINLARTEFEQADVPILDFNPWLFSGADQLLNRFFSELSAAMSNTPGLGDLGRHLKRYGEILSPAVAAISTLVGSPLSNKTLRTILKSICNTAEAPATAVDLRKRLTETLERREKPIVVVLDDVDRLSKDEIRELFKLVRLTANFPNLIYIVACDRVRVEEALDDSDSSVPGNYLEKIFQWSIDVPVASHERIRRELLGSLESALCGIPMPFDEKDWPDIEAEVIRPLVRNMRDVRRYSMAVRGMSDDLRQSISLVDTLALEAIRLFMPRFFGELPNLIDVLTVAPAWESNRERIGDIIFEQMGDTQKAAELRRTRLEDVLEKVDAGLRPVARAVIHRLFLGGVEHHDNDDPEWSIQHLRNNRVVHRLIFRLYLTRVEDGDLASSNSARLAIRSLHDPRALDELIRSQDPDTWPTIILFLWNMFKRDFETRHAEPALIVFWNLLPDMPRQNPGGLDEPRLILRTVSISLLETLVGTDGAVRSINTIFRQLQSLTSKVAFITLIKAFIRENSSLISDAELHEIEDRLNNQILSINADDLLTERHPAQILLFSSVLADPPGVPHMIHDSPKLTFALLLDCLTESSSSEFGSRSAEMTHGIDWDGMIAIHRDEATLRTRINSLDQRFSTIKSWVDSELGVPFTDAQCILQLARTYADGTFSQD